MRKRVAAVIGLAFVAGCESVAPTLSVEAAGPSLDGGVVFGSGHRSDSTTTGNNNATTQESGGVVFGSGH
jgi:hypothetical protein